MAAGTVLLPLVLLAWLLACAWAAHRIADLFFDRRLRNELKAVIFIALLPVILVDEMLGRPQFDELCRERAVMSITADHVADRTVARSEAPPESLPGQFVPVQLVRAVYADVGTGEIVFSYDSLRAGGGKLVRAIGNGSNESEPLTFGGRCEPPFRLELMQALGLRVVSEGR